MRETGSGRRCVELHYGTVLGNKSRTQLPSTSRNSSRKWNGIAPPKESHSEIPRHSTDFCNLARQKKEKKTCICQEIDKK